MGSIIQQEGEIGEDVNHRVQAGWVKWRSASGVLYDRRIPLKLKEKFYKTAIRPAIIHGIECWTILKQHVNKLRVTEMRMLRWICGKTLKERIRNEHIREMVGVAPIEDKMRENRLRWFGHIQRKPLDASVRKSDLLTIHGNARGRGRPKLTWIEIIKKYITSCNLSVSLALDRSEWRKQIHVADPM